MEIISQVPSELWFAFAVTTLVSFIQVASLWRARSRSVSRTLAHSLVTLIPLIGPLLFFTMVNAPDVQAKELRARENYDAMIWYHHNR